MGGIPLAGCLCHRDAWHDSGVRQRGKQDRGKGKMEEMGAKVLSCLLGEMVDGKLVGARHW